MKPPSLVPRSPPSTSERLGNMPVDVCSDLSEDGAIPGLFQDARGLQGIKSNLGRPSLLVRLSEGAGEGLPWCFGFQASHCLRLCPSLISLTSLIFTLPPLAYALHLWKTFLSLYSFPSSKLPSCCRLNVCAPPTPNSYVET